LPTPSGKPSRHGLHCPRRPHQTVCSGGLRLPEMGGWQPRSRPSSGCAMQPAPSVATAISPSGAWT